MHFFLCMSIRLQFINTLFLNNSSIIWYKQLSQLFILLNYINAHENGIHDMNIYLLKLVFHQVNKFGILI